MKTCLWLFVFATSLMDMWFFWHFQSIMREVELNPVALYFFSHGGVPAVFGLRGGILLYAFAMSKTHTKISGFVLPVWVMGHALLLMLLVGSFLETAE